MSTLCIRHRSISDIEIGHVIASFPVIVWEFRRLNVLQVVTGDKEMGYQWTIAYMEGNWFPEFASSSS
jgi:hypothetical protein